MMLSRSRPVAAQVAPAKVEETELHWEEFVGRRDYTGALGILEFEQANGKTDDQTKQWIAYCCFHLGEHQKALDIYNVRPGNLPRGGGPLNTLTRTSPPAAARRAAPSPHVATPAQELLKNPECDPTFFAYAACWCASALARRRPVAPHCAGYLTRSPPPAATSTWECTPSRASR